VNREFKNYFKRQIELWGEERQRSLLSKRVLIVGCGGLGSSIGLSLAGSGIGHIDLLDFDRVALHNVHRQIAFELKELNLFKSSTLAKRIEERNPFVEVTAYEMGFEEFVGGTESRVDYDIILDATDSIEIRGKIDFWAKERGTPWVYGSVEEFNAQICLFERASFKVFANTKHTPKGISAPMVMQTASFQSNLALRYLINLSVKKDLLYYMYYNSEGDLILQKFKMPID
jgi:molybdopterin/thiamine biosynthesis adenylyltransferase